VAGAQDAKAAQNPPTVPTFPSAVELITVDAVVVDSEGHRVRGLSRDDFVVEEDGNPQEIVGFEAFALGWVEAPPPAAPRASDAPAAEPTMGNAQFAILVDDLRIAQLRGGQARQAAEVLLDRSFRPGDEVTVGTTSGDVWWSTRLPEGRDDLYAVLGRIKGR